MANVSYWFGFWQSAGPDSDLLPGEVHNWIAWPINYGDALSVTATPVQGGLEHILAVENVRMQSDQTGRRIFYTVRNVGQTAVPGYGVGYGYISA